MILYDPAMPVSLEEFGIHIPVRDSRTRKTLQALLGDSELRARQGSWHLQHIVETLSRADLLRAHAPDYVERLYSPALQRELLAAYELVDGEGNYHRYDPSSATRPLADLFERVLLKAAATVQGARLALRHSFCFVFSGGAHHAQYDFGNGFCLLNDVVIAARKLQDENVVEKVWVIDVDAHKGDGTAALTAGDALITTLSIHMAHGWPLDGAANLTDGRPNPSFVPSDIDIPIAPGEEGQYLSRLEEGLGRLGESGPADLAFVVCGADPFVGDELPSASLLQLSLAQMLARDQLLYNWLTARSIPAVFLMAGGYGEEVWRVYAQFLRWVLRLRYLGKE